MSKNNKVQDSNFIVIHGWMIRNLGLKGNALLLYAIIFGFSQTEGQTYNAGLQYLADWTNSTKQGVLNALQTLLKKGYIDKTEQMYNGVKFVQYCAKDINTIKESLTVSSGKESLIGIKESLTGPLNKVEWDHTTKFNETIKQSLPNNIYNNITNNIEDNINNNIYNAPSEQVALEPTVIELVLNDKSLYPITEKQLNDWIELYPNIDVMQNLRNMRGWLDANPTKRKTKRGILRFVNSWLAREQDKPRKTSPQTTKDLAPVLDYSEFY